MRCVAFFFAVGLSLAAMVGSASAMGDGLTGGGDESDPGGGSGTIDQDDGPHGASFTLRYASDMVVTSSREGTPGRRADCGYYEIVTPNTDPNSPDFQFSINPVLGGLEVGEDYLLYCWEPGGFPVLNGVPGSPWPFTCCTPGTPGDDMAEMYDLIEFATRNVGFVEPGVEVSPTTEQVVGVPTWLAVTSQLDYAPVAATVDTLWARATPTFSHAVWEFGNGEQVTCTEDVALLWNADLGAGEQDSACTYTFESNGDGDPFVGEVTVFWDIAFESSDTGGAVEDGGTIQPWTTVSENATVVFDVRELQAVID